MALQSVRVVIVPGNGAGNVHTSNWYGWLYKKLQQRPGVTAILQNMPDPLYAREKVWIPFMKQELGCGPDTIVVGHSSGAAAAMRLAEADKLAGIVLVSAYSSDLGDELEAGSGYFNRPWDWQAIKHNAGFIVQFGSEDDPFLPWPAQQLVADELGAELHRFQDRGHFQNTVQPELLRVLEEKLEGLLQPSST